MQPGDVPSGNVTADDVLVVGDSAGDSPYVFGQVEDVVTLRDGALAVLDSRMYELRLFDPAGTHVASAGREGEGPGEFADPVDLAVTGDGELLVLDLQRPGITRWAYTEPELTEVGSIPLGVFGDAFCLLGDRLFIHAPHEDRAVHEVSWDGDVLRSFGEVWEPDDLDDARSRAARITFFVGYIACLPEADVIIRASRNRPMVRAFTPAGRERWTRDIPGFHRMVAVPTDRGTTVYMGEGETHWSHRIEAVSALGEDRVAVHVGQTGMAGTGVDEGMTETFIYDARSGELVGYTRAVPPFAGVRDDRAVSGRELPFPAVTVHALEIGLD